VIPLLLIRHGRTEWNAQKKLQGRRDIPLSSEGREILETCEIPEQFSHFHWRSSPLKRAEQTAQILGATDLVLDDRLIEMDWGKWEGYTIRELRAQYGSAMKDNEAKGLQMCPEGGESPADVQNRLLPFLQELKTPTIAVTHKGVIRAIKSLAYNWDMTDKSPVPFNWNAGHLFMIDELGRPHAEAVNIELDVA